MIISGIVILLSYIIFYTNLKDEIDIITHALITLCMVFFINFILCFCVNHNYEIIAQYEMKDEVKLVCNKECYYVFKRKSNDGKGFVARTTSIELTTIVDKGNGTSKIVVEREKPNYLIVLFSTKHEKYTIYE